MSSIKIHTNFKGLAGWVWGMDAKVWLIRRTPTWCASTEYLWYSWGVQIPPVPLYQPKGTGLHQYQAAQRTTEGILTCGVEFYTDFGFCGPQRTITNNPTRSPTKSLCLTIDFLHNLLLLTVPLDVFGSSSQSPRNPPSIFLRPLCLNLVALKVSSRQIRATNWPGAGRSKKWPWRILDVWSNQQGLTALPRMAVQKYTTIPWLLRFGCYSMVEAFLKNSGPPRHDRHATSRHVIFLNLLLKFFLKLFLNISVQDKDHDIFDPGSSSDGLSLPRNLIPERKICSWNCPRTRSW